MAKRAFTANPSPSFSRITVDLTRFFTARRHFFRQSVLHTLTASQTEEKVEDFFAKQVEFGQKVVRFSF